MQGKKCSVCRMQVVLNTYMHIEISTILKFYMYIV